MILFLIGLTTILIIKDRKSRKLIREQKELAEKSRNETENLRSMLAHDWRNGLHVLNSIGKTKLEDLLINEKTQSKFKDYQLEITALVSYLKIITSRNSEIKEVGLELFKKVAEDICTIHKRKDISISVFSNLELGKDKENSLENERKNLQVLAMIVGELVRNSCKYAFPSIAEIHQPTIEIHVIQNEDNSLHIYYKDNGIGIQDKEVKENSLGLKLTEKQIKKYDGTIKIENNIPSGVHITIYFDRMYFESV